MVFIELIFDILSSNSQLNSLPLDSLSAHMTQPEDTHPSVPALFQPIYQSITNNCSPVLQMTTTNTDPAVHHQKPRRRSLFRPNPNTG
jgi:hypothetical protein